MAKKVHEKRHEEHPDETWLVPYADILTLLLALFIVLFASSSLDKKKAGQLEQIFTAAFTGTPNPMHGTLLNFMEDLKDLDIGEETDLGSDSEGALIEVANIDMFEEGSNIIKRKYVNIIYDVAALLKQNKYARFNIVVEGHTDSDEAKIFRSGSTWDLSSSRASSVVEEFIDAGISSNRLRAVGMADISPKFPNLNAYGEKIPENQKKNRRVVIRVEP